MSILSYACQLLTMVNIWKTSQEASIGSHATLWAVASPRSYLSIFLSSLIVLFVLLFLFRRSEKPYKEFHHIEGQRQTKYFSFTSRATAAAHFASQGPRQVRDAYMANKTAPFYIQSINRLVLSPSTLQELSQLSPDLVSLRENFVDRYAGRWTGFDVILETSLFSDVVRVGLIQNLGNYQLIL